ncbi:MAG TPA: acyl-CoA dehydrogenase [Planctomycetes bacterium]|nr:acyl-CoA dehydrogenase [Planctomycetota bacterium]
MGQHKQPGFLRTLFQGTLDSSLLLPFPWPDEEVRETTETVAEMVRDWAHEAIDPAEIDARKRIPESVLDGMAELGLFGLTLPEEYGGSGCGQWTYAHVMEALANRCASTVTVLGGHLGLGTKGLVLYGTEEQKARWFPELASGERIAAFALTEAGAGSDAGALRTTADPDGNGNWRIDGRKLWITNGGFARWFLVFARTPHPDRPDAPLMERPITAFWVPREASGLTTGEPENKMGLCGSSTTEVGLEGVVVGDDHRVGELGEGFKVALNVLNSGRHGLAACCIGQAKLARDLSLAHAVQREQFGRPIAEFGMMRELIAGMDADIYAMEAGCWLTAGLVDRGETETMLEAAACKMFSTERLWDICNSALQLTGGTGFMREYPFERILRDARINLIFEGTNQVLRMMLSVQGTRALVRGEASEGPESPRFEGAAAGLEREAEVLGELAGAFAAEARASVERHGKEIREAQHDLRRLSDLAVGLFQTAAVLSRASTCRGELSEQERDLASLACRRIEAGLRATLAECKETPDELVDRASESRIRASRPS